MPGARGRPHKREIYEGRLNNNVTARAARAARVSFGRLGRRLGTSDKHPLARAHRVGLALGAERAAAKRPHFHRPASAGARPQRRGRESRDASFLSGGDRPSSTDLSTALRHRPSLQSCVFTRGVRPRVAPTNPTVRPRRAYWGPANESAEAGGRRAPAITAHFEEYDHSDKAKRDACFHEPGEASPRVVCRVQASAVGASQPPMINQTLVAAAPAATHAGGCFAPASAASLTR